MLSNSLSTLITCLALGTCSALASTPPRILDAVPPADGSRGLVRVSDTEIRHYGGEVEVGSSMPCIVSHDNGETWSELQYAQEKFPKKYSGLPNEAPAIIYLPRCQKYMMIQAIGDFFFMADELDGEWVTPNKEGTAFVGRDVWASDRSEVYHLPKGLFRNPLELSTGRIIVAKGHSPEGSKFMYSDDQGLTWQLSKDSIVVPAFKEEGIDKDLRWRNSGAEGTAVELKNGDLYALVRSDQNHSFESISHDGGDTWSEPKASPFYSTVTMSTLGRLANGKIICLWTNTAPMPEVPHGKGSRWEDVFTNRGSLHVAYSEDEGKTWQGYREVWIDGQRNSPTFAVEPGKHDRSCHQSEYLELDDKRILVSAGQHPLHRKMMIFDQDWMQETGREEDIVKNGLANLHAFVFVPPAYSIQYNRKLGVEQVSWSGDGVMDAVKFGILNDASLIQADMGIDYRYSGVTWNFPKADAGEVSFSLRFAEGSSGCHVSLTDRMFNPCDASTPLRSVFTLKLAPAAKLGSFELKANTDYQFRLSFKGSQCDVYVNDSPEPVAQMDLVHQPSVGISYLHFISSGDEAVSSGKPSIDGSHFYQFDEGGKVLEKSTTVKDLKMKR